MMMTPAGSDSMAWAADEGDKSSRFGSQNRRLGSTRRPLSARALTLFELVVAVALVAALAGVALPLVLARSRNIAFDELLIQIERTGAVARSESQRKSTPLRFEARWDAASAEYLIGVSRLDTDEEEDHLAGVVRAIEEEPGAHDEFESGAVTLSGFETMLTLGPRVQLHRGLSDDLREMLLNPSDGSGAIGGATRGEFDAKSDERRMKRFTLAIFLPDGTLIAGESVYLVTPPERIARIASNAFLGSISATRITQAMLESEDDIDLFDPSSREGEETGDASREPVPRGLP